MTQDQALQKLKQQARRQRRSNPETSIVKACLQVLKLMGIEAWRNNTGALIDRTGRPVTYGRVGSADITGIWLGRRIEIEVKQPGLEPTREQQAFLAMIRQNGGVALVVHSADELLLQLKNLDSLGRL